MLTLPERKFIDNLLIVTDLSKEDEEMLYDIGRAKVVQTASSMLAKGEISSDDFLDMVEMHVPIDDYLDEVCQNLEVFLQYEYFCR